MGRKNNGLPQKTKLNFKKCTVCGNYIPDNKVKYHCENCDEKLRKEAIRGIKIRIHY
jgi:predicted nucleic acid-binding Zn ribbon protein